MKRYVAIFTLPSLFRVGGKRFYPGVNEVTQEEWESIKNHPLVKRRFDMGHLKWADGKSPYQKEKQDNVCESYEKQEEFTALDSLNGKDAIKLVYETLQPDLLNKWKECEKRKGVLSAIEEQLKKFDDAESENEA